MTTGMLPEYAPQNGSYTIVLSGFKDAAGVAVIPDTLTWTLCDVHGAVVNSREAVSVTPDSTVTIVLTGDDLAYLDGELENHAVIRIVHIAGEYDSSIGLDLQYRDEILFRIEPISFPA